MSAPPPLLRPPRPNNNNKSNIPKLRLPNLNLQAPSQSIHSSISIIKKHDDLVPKPVALPSLAPLKHRSVDPLFDDRSKSSDLELNTTTSALNSLKICTSSSTSTPLTRTTSCTESSSTLGVFSAEIITEVEQYQDKTQNSQRKVSQTSIRTEYTDVSSLDDTLTYASSTSVSVSEASETQKQPQQDQYQQEKHHHYQQQHQLKQPQQQSQPLQSFDLSTLTEDQWRQLSLTNSIIPLTHLGEGTSGTVVKARLRNHSSIFALKQIIASDTETSKQLLRELRFNKEFHSEFIVRYYGMFLNERTASVYIAMEFMSGGSLDAIYKHAISHNRIIGEKVIGKINDSVLQGLAYLNSKGVIHRDIKPQNILIDGCGKTKICDFGVSGILENSFATTFTGTSFYMAPERIQGGSYSITSDIWSLGLTLMEVSIGCFPLDLSLESSPIDILSEIINFKPDLSSVRSKGFSESYVSFIEFCLRSNPKERPSARQLLEHPWAKGQRKKTVDMKAWVEACWN